ncbi:MAG: pseudaminic acid synthase [Methanomassiliicoccus sp.]|nr:MAG: pseudaminic acid synthase [Methanomassiliicoccus sp.]
MERVLNIDGRLVGDGHPAYCIAELSANHNQDLDQAKGLIKAAKEAGADAVKIQTYTPDTITIDCRAPEFMIDQGSLWEKRYLYDLYKEAYTPWEWQPELKRYADEIGITLFSSPFDSTAVDLLEKMGVPVYKIASFELVDIPLIKKVAGTGKPIIMSTGMATLEEIDEAVAAVRDLGNDQLCLLKCLSAYPSPVDRMNLRGMETLCQRYECPVGVSDHTLGTLVPTVAVALGASLIEKHFTLSRSIKGPDSAFSLEPQEFKEMVQGVRSIESSLGNGVIAPSPEEDSSRKLRRSLFVVRDMHAGETFTPENVRSIRPGHGLHTRHWEEVLDRKASRPLSKGMPLRWDMVE